MWFCLFSITTYNEWYSVEYLCNFSITLQRGSDVPNSPVMYAYLIVEMDGAKLFVDTSKVSSEVMDHLKSAGVELRPYDSIISEIEK